MEAVMRLIMRSTLFAASLLALAASAEAKSRVAWEGGFWGGRWVEETPLYSNDDFFGNGGGGGFGREVKRTIYHREHRLFASSRACEAWLYQMRSTWQDMPRYSWCKQVRVRG
jgi:hypothetical protein